MIKGNTAKGQRVLAMARRYEGYYLWDVYDRFSQAKQKAWEWCLEQCKQDEGEHFHICSHNSHRFTVAWEYMNKETGELMTRVETASNTYIVDGSR